MASSARELAELCLEQPYGAIVCDDAIRGRMCMETLELIRQHDPDIPFIVLIDTPDVNDITQEDVLTELMLRGATDCVDKKRLSVLSIAVAFAVEERVLSEERNRIDQELERSRVRCQALSVIEDVTVQSTAEVNLG
jgi:DNA-binding NtrC family response regulator